MKSKVDYVSCLSTSLCDAVYRRSNREMLMEPESMQRVPSERRTRI